MATDQQIVEAAISADLQHRDTSWWATCRRDFAALAERVIAVNENHVRPHVR